MCKVISQLQVRSGNPRGRGATRRALAATAAGLMFAVLARAAEEKPEIRMDKEAIRAALESYVVAYNRGDAKAVAAHWSESGEWISPSGRTVPGKTGHRGGDGGLVRREQRVCGLKCDHVSDSLDRRGRRPGGRHCPCDAPGGTPQRFDLFGDPREEGRPMEVG